MTKFKHYNHLGFHNPYYIRNGNKFNFYSSFEEAIEQIPDQDRFLDFTAVVEVFSTGYCFGDRTLIKGLNKTPWMAKPNVDNTDWDYFNVPDHKENILEEPVIVDTFYNLLEEELLSYIKDHETIGILLTGGMDSRIVAAVLVNLQKKKLIDEKHIVAYTWGFEESRDVVYSKRIASLFGWKWKHVVVDAEQMTANCSTAIENGCEFTPIHLHAMTKVAEEEGIDCVLGGSFGDSVGRAEFSGRNVRDLASLRDKIGNIGGLLRKDFLEFSKEDIENDLQRYHNLFPQDHAYQLYEQDQQLHYMRRMLNACMSVIDKKIPLYQMFSSPKVFGFMWSLDPSLRTNAIYRLLLEKYRPELLDIPWARTGKKYNENEGEADRYRKSHHDYGTMIRKYFTDYIENSIVSNEKLARIIFNTGIAKRLLKNLNRYPIQGGLVFEDRLLYLAQVLNFMKKYNVKINLPKNNGSFIDLVKQDVYYKGKYFYKKIK
ncbi:asparagine synthase-related protein [Sphingobacterium lactis]|uniref:asparagine synthase-related protein n=1 Tax=Sphingobacterium lactis TaxID=797291 RepID=UPI003EC61FDE